MAGRGLEGQWDTWLYVWRCWYRWLLVSCEILTTISCNVAIWLTNLPFLIRVQTMLIMFKCQAMVMHWENHFILIYLLWTHLAAPHESKTFWVLWWQISLLLQTILNKSKDQYTCTVYGYTVYVWYILKFTCFFWFFFFFQEGGRDRFRIFQANNNSLQQFGLSMHEHLSLSLFTWSCVLCIKKELLHNF